MCNKLTSLIFFRNYKISNYYIREKSKTLRLTTFKFQRKLYGNVVIELLTESQSWQASVDKNLRSPAKCVSEKALR